MHARTGSHGQQRKSRRWSSRRAALLLDGNHLRCVSAVDNLPRSCGPDSPASAKHALPGCLRSISPPKCSTWPIEQLLRRLRLSGTHTCAVFEAGSSPPIALSASSASRSVSSLSVALVSVSVPVNSRIISDCKHGLHDGWLFNDAVRCADHCRLGRAAAARHSRLNSLRGHTFDSRRRQDACKLTIATTTQTAECI